MRPFVRAERRRFFLRLAVALGVASIALCGCGATSTAPKKAEAPPEPVTGLHALYQMFAASHAWAPDAQVYNFTSIHLSDVKPQPGKAGAWQAVFVSPSLQQSRTYTFSVIEASMSLHQGINSGKPDAWSGPNASSQPFSIAAARVDSDAAYQTALKKAAAFDAKKSGHGDDLSVYRKPVPTAMPRGAYSGAKAQAPANFRCWWTPPREHTWRRCIEGWRH